MSPATQQMQRDDALNPGMLWVLGGAALWRTPAGPQGRSCASCHGDAAPSMRGVATRYPAFDARRAGPITLSQRINQCRADRMGAEPFAPESEALLSLEALVANASRGQPIAATRDPRLEPFRARGEAIYHRRMGQLDFSCAQCHDDRPGGRLGGSVIPQALPTGYPIYRLEWQTLGSLERRLRGCMTGVRAEPFEEGSAHLLALEVYLASRAAGLAVETPAVRP